MLREDDAVFLVTRGEVDLDTADQLAAIGTLALKEPATRRLVVDLSAVSFVDSFGLGVLVQLHTSAQGAGAQLVLRRPRDQLLRILKITDLGTLFTVEK